MSRWETTSRLEADVPPAAVWERAYASAEAWPKWNTEIKRASLDGPLALDAIPGAWERTQEGLAQAARGEGTPLDKLA